jgi:type IV secretory pathway VirD2 relaxase
MRTRGAGAMIPMEYQGVNTPVVKLQIVYRRDMRYAELAAYVAYLAKHGKGEDGGPGEHFTRDGQEPDIPAFLARLWKGRWCFKVIVSPSAEVGSQLPLQEFAQCWMQQVEADLGVKLDWVAGAHFDTAHPHLQFLWSGITLAGELVRIDRHYLQQGMRARAAEVIDFYG